jgi:hypothetical protein
MINNGPGIAANVVLTDALPLTLNLVSVVGTAGWDCTGSTLGVPGVVLCTKASMAVGETAQFTLNTTITDALGADPVINEAVVATATSETTTANNQDNAIVEAEDLPATGADPVPLAAFGAVLVLLGLVLQQGARRLRRSPGHAM